MSKIAFVFSGQGAQYTGMGKELYDANAAARDTFAALDAIRPGTSQQCFTASKDALSETVNTQPCMFAVSLAAAAAISSYGIRADGAAGFSCGEIAALAYSEALPLADAFGLSVRRAGLMDDCAHRRAGAMAAILKLPSEKVGELCAGYTEVYPVNYNCPGQCVIAGDETQIDDFVGRISEHGGKAIKLAVSGAFHSPFMREAGDALGEALRDYRLNTPKIPVYSNVTALPYAGDMRGLISRQVTSPVKWQPTVENMINDGFDTFVECGAGKTLCGLIRKISDHVNVYNVDNRESLDNTINMLTGGE